MLPIPAASYLFSLQWVWLNYQQTILMGWAHLSSATEEQITSSTYSITISSAAMSSIANNLQPCIVDFM